MASATAVSTPVIGLKTYQVAKRGAVALRGLLHEPEWLVDVKARVLASGDLELVALVTTDAMRVRMCLPASIDDIPVRVENVNAGVSRTKSTPRPSDKPTGRER